MTKKIYFFQGLLAVLYLTTASAQNKLQYYQVRPSNTSIHQPFVIANDVFFPTESQSIGFQGINKRVKAEFQKQRVVKMSYSGYESGEWQGDNSSNIVWYREIYKGIDLLVAGKNDATLFTFYVSPFGNLVDIAFSTTNKQDWSVVLPNISQEINEKTRHLKGYFDVDGQKINIKCNDYNLDETLKVEFSQSSKQDFIFTKN
jgi:hypothetical protein